MDNNDNINTIDDENIENEELIEDIDYGGEFHEKDKHIENNIVSEVKTSFLDYSMSVITSRALPDLRDGLKPVHRRILWSMYEEGNTPDKPHKKSATTVGYVMGHYHPHGDSSIYDAMVRLAQDFNQRYMLVDGHGNFGTIEGDSPAAYRYTEARLAKISLELLRDIQKDTVDMDDNYTSTEKEPKVLPSRFPNILVNGSMGIAVGMATNIPPHNLGEVIDGCVAYIDNPDIDTLGLMHFIKGPDFPTGGIILGNSGIKKAYDTGRGTITIRSRAVIEEQKGQKSRSGGGVRRGFEGGQTPLYRRLPKRGFTNIHASNYTEVTLTMLNKSKADVVTAESLIEEGIISKANDGIVVLATGNLDKKLTVKATRFTKAAKEKIEAAGGKAEVI